MDEKKQNTYTHTHIHTQTHARSYCGRKNSVVEFVVIDAELFWSFVVD